MVVNVLIRNVTKEDLEKALEILNQKYDNNVTWNRFQQISSRSFRVTLRVKDSKKAGHRIAYWAYVNGKIKRLPYACWHTHGDFFDILLNINPNAVIQVLNRKIYRVGNEIVNNWVDWNIGSLMYPLYYSEACECYR